MINSFNMVPSPELSPDGSDELSLVLESVQQHEGTLSQFEDLLDTEAQQHPDFEERINNALAQLGDDTELSQNDYLAVIKKEATGDLKEYLTAHLDTLITSYEEYNALQEKIGVLAQQKIEDEQNFIKDHVDMEALISSIVAAEDKETGADLQKILQATHSLLAISENSFQSTKLQAIEKYPELVESLKKTGVVLDEFAENKEIRLSLEELFEAVDDWVQHTANSIWLMGDERKKHTIDELNKFEDTAARLQEIARLHTAYDSMQPLIVGALQKNLDNAMNSVDASDEEFIAEQAKSRPNALYLSGVHKLKETTGIGDPRAWLNTQINRFPHWARTGLGSIKIESHLHTSDPNFIKTDLFDGEINGGMSMYKNNIRLSSKQNLFNTLTQSDVPPPLEHTHEHIQHEIQHSLLHEMTHYVHYQRLPLKELRRFVIIAEQERVHVSEYVEYSKVHGVILDATGISEDLADSSALYFTKPDKLFREAPQRFKLIQEWFNAYPENQVTALYDPSTPKDVKEKLTILLMPPDELQKLLQSRGQ